jgi:hypothetical protein
MFEEAAPWTNRICFHGKNVFFTSDCNCFLKKLRVRHQRNRRRSDFASGIPKARVMGT